MFVISIITVINFGLGPSLVGVLLSNFGIECHFLDVYETICFVLYFSNRYVFQVYFVWFLLTEEKLAVVQLSKNNFDLSKYKQPKHFL